MTQKISTIKDLTLDVVIVPHETITCAIDADHKPILLINVPADQTDPAECLAFILTKGQFEHLLNCMVDMCVKLNNPSKLNG